MHLFIQVGVYLSLPFIYQRFQVNFIPKIGMKVF